MSNVIPLFPDAAVAEVESDKVQEFVAEHLGEFLFAVQGLVEAETEDDAIGFMDEIRDLVESWPR